MRDDFINLLDLEYEKDKPDLVNRKSFLHRVIPYVVYKDPNPNRLRVYLTQNSEYVSKYVSGINQTFLLTRKIHDLEFYALQFEKLGLTIRNPLRFIKLIKSGNSFLLTDDDFESEIGLLYANVYVLTPINELVTTVQQNLYYLKTDYIERTVVSFL
jgi:hypothetical protein